MAPSHRALILIALLAPPLVVGAATASVPAAPVAAGAPARLVVGFHATPPALAPGDAYLGGEVVAVSPALRFVVVGTPDAGARAQALADAHVRYAEPDVAAQWLLHAPTDPLFDAAHGQYGPQLVRAPEAWDTTLGTTAATVCLVDTGVRHTHEDIAGDRWLGGTDLHNGDDAPWDDNGHGTHTAGIAAATTDNGLGIAGVAQAGILSVKVVNATGFGHLTTVASGIQWCADHGGPRTIVAVPLGLHDSHHPALRDAVAHAWEQGALVVAAAGNHGPCTDCVAYPAAYPEAMAVACVDAYKATCSFSSRGSEVALAAPGTGILSTHADHDAHYRKLSGTSMSAAHAAGVAALLWSHAPDLTNAEVRHILAESAEDVGKDGRDTATGCGLVDATGALASADDLDAQPDAWREARFAASGLLPGLECGLLE